MTDNASLGFTISMTGADKALATLRGVQTSASTTGAAMDKLREQVDKADASLAKTSSGSRAASVSATAAANDKLAASIMKVEAATGRLRDAETGRFVAMNASNAAAAAGLRTMQQIEAGHVRNRVATVSATTANMAHATSSMRARDAETGRFVSIKATQQAMETATASTVAASRSISLYERIIVGAGTATSAAARAVGLFAGLMSGARGTVSGFGSAMLSIGTTIRGVATGLGTGLVAGIRSAVAEYRNLRTAATQAAAAARTAGAVGGGGGGGGAGGPPSATAAGSAAAGALGATTAGMAAASAGGVILTRVINIAARALVGLAAAAIGGVGYALTTMADRVRVASENLRAVIGNVNGAKTAIESLQGASQRTGTSFASLADDARKLIMLGAANSQGSLFSQYFRVPPTNASEQSKIIIAALENIDKSLQTSNLNAQARATIRGNIVSDISEKESISLQTLKSIALQSPKTFGAIIEGSGASGPALLKLAEAGKFTGRMLFEYINRAATSIEAEFKRMPGTFERSREALVTSFENLGDRIQRATNFKPGDMLDKFREKLDGIQPTATGVAETMERLGRAFEIFAVGVTASIATGNPIIGVLTAAGYAAVKYGDGVKLSADGTITLRNALNNTATTIADAAEKYLGMNRALDDQGNKLVGLRGLWESFDRQVATTNANNASAVDKFVTDWNAKVKDMAGETAKEVKLMATVFVTIPTIIGTAFAGIPRTVLGYVRDAVNGMILLIQDAINKVAEMIDGLSAPINSKLAKLGGPQIPSVGRATFAKPGEQFWPGETGDQARVATRDAMAANGSAAEAATATAIDRMFQGLKDLFTQSDLQRQQDERVSLEAINGVAAAVQSVETSGHEDSQQIVSATKESGKPLAGSLEKWVSGLMTQTTEEGVIMQRNAAATETITPAVHGVEGAVNGLAGSGGVGGGGSSSSSGGERITFTADPYARQRAAVAATNQRKQKESTIIADQLAAGANPKDLLDAYYPGWEKKHNPSDWWKMQPEEMGPGFTEEPGPIKDLLRQVYEEQKNTTSAIKDAGKNTGLSEWWYGTQTENSMLYPSATNSNSSEAAATATAAVRAAAQVAADAAMIREKGLSAPPGAWVSGGMPFADSLAGFAGGGSFMVGGGGGGTDSNVVAFRASPDERVTIETPEQQRGGRGGQINYMTINVQAPDPSTFMKTKDQMAREISAALARAAR